ncbi:Hypothetical protein PHPALM_16174 [Phytophthora palmivora]|uniref:Multicopper oxidase n=1 Tax=Phytophthora palmivora TaxID=4796 RepID=A0A2P4XQE9_9STRA|nr:Hypothetical protein PHPALM_16174 [Phytophthora palmivora]
MDGTSGITQCHIQPNASVTYTFTPDKAGTFWWHSHFSYQYAFGLRGPLIVHAPTDQLQSWEKNIDGEYTIQLADMYHATPGHVAPMWDTILINDLGRYNCTAAASHGYNDCSDDQPLSTFRFEQGKKYRLRVINMAALAPFVFSIDDHELQVIAADAELVEPTDLITNVTINAGQRYDLIVQAKSTTNGGPIGSFWMRATGLYGVPWTAASPETAGEGFNDVGLGIVHYEADAAIEPTSIAQAKMSTIGEFEYTPLNKTTLPKTPSDRTILKFDFASGLGYFSIDGSELNHFMVPDDPPLFSIANGSTTADLPTSINARAISFGDHVEAVLVNVMNDQHPFHMHSHTPWVIGSGTASLEDIQNNNLPAMNLDVRFNADNEGVWIMHCHIDWHLDGGLAMVFVEGEKEIQTAGLSAFSNNVLSVCGMKYTS